MGDCRMGLIRILLVDLGILAFVEDWFRFCPVVSLTGVWFGRIPVSKPLLNICCSQPFNALDIIGLVLPTRTGGLRY